MMEEKIWMKWWPEGTPRKAPFKLGPKPVFEYIRHYANTIPDKAALIFYGKHISYKEFDENSNKVANYLISKGIKEGDRVGIYMYNSPEFLYVFYGIQKVGAIAVPFNVLFRPLETKYQLTDCTATAIFAQDEFFSMIDEIKDEIPSVKFFVSSNFAKGLPAEPDIDIPQKYVKPPVKVDYAEKLEDILANGDITAPDIAVDVNSVSILEYTGGTTGLPKGTMLTHYSDIFTATSSIHFWPVKSDDVFTCCALFSHILGIDFTQHTFVTGATYVIVAIPDTEPLMQMIDRYKISNIHTITPINLAIMSHPNAKKYDFSSLKLDRVTSFVVFINEEICAQWKEFSGGCELIETAFGLTETHTMNTIMPLHRNKYNRGQGVPVFETDIIIVDSENRDKILGPEEIGEILIKSPGNAIGYWNKPEETKNAFYKGYMCTGDIGRMDDEGYVYWMGRYKEAMKVAGYTVLPEEVEAMMNLHPDILETAAIPVPDEKKGDVVKAFITLQPDSKITAEALIAWAKKNMSAQKVPQYIEFMDVLPKSATGKLLRRELVELEKKRREEDGLLCNIV